MGIVYGAMLACMAPVMWHWAGAPSALASNPAPIPVPLRYLFLMMAAGVVASGLRDLAAALELRGSQWPWRYATPAEPSANRGGPPPLMAGLAAKVPGARHASVPDAAHIANIQNPEGFNRLLADFLK